MIKKTFFLIVFLFAITSFSQESVFYQKNNKKSFKLKKFGLEVSALNFIKNNEYFNFIADGYTLLGTQIHPEFIYNSSKKTQFKAGVFLLKHFGNPKIAKAIPTFTFNYLDGKHLFTFGNLYAKDNHQMIEPLLASEKILTSEVLETGVQYVYNSQKFYIDSWFSWENYIEKYADEREEFSIGVTAKQTLFQSQKNTLKIPLQFLYYHRGGQINKKYRETNGGENLILNFKNVASGLIFTHKNEDYQLQFSYYYMMHVVNSEKEEFRFTHGNAQYITAKIISKKMSFSLGFYKANRFIAAKGNDMFQTYSVKINNNYWNGVLDDRYLNHTEPNRTLLFSRFQYKKRLSKHVLLGFQAAGFYQLNNAIVTVLPALGNTKNNFDYSYGLYLTFNDIFSF